jgi:hypothetical protein
MSCLSGDALLRGPIHLFLLGDAYCGHARAAPDLQVKNGRAIAVAGQHPIAKDFTDFLRYDFPGFLIRNSL